jgi:hypothetical protein
MASSAYRHCLAGRGAGQNRVAHGPGGGDLRYARTSGQG